MEYLTTVYYRIKGKPNDLQDIYDQYRTLLNKKLLEEGKDKSVSYASMVYSLGVDTKEQYLRGNIIKCEFVDNSLSIEAEEDWVTANFRHPLESYYEGMTIYYMVESYCDETYATNDAEGKYFPTRVSVDFHLKEPVLCGYERFNSMDEALAYFAHVLKRDTLTVDDIHKWNCEHWKDGFIYFKQRIKRMIVTSGYNVYPSQLENIIDGYDKVLLSCVIGVKDPYRVQRVKAYVVPMPGVEPSEALRQELMEYCAKRIAKYAMPREIVFRAELPKTLVGKVAYRVLEDEEKARIAAQAAQPEA